MPLFSMVVKALSFREASISGSSDSFEVLRHPDLISSGYTPPDHNIALLIGLSA
jgi:hypothetical protein